MEKIVPSLLFNMQSGPLTSTEEATPSSPPSNFPYFLFQYFLIQYNTFFYSSCGIRS
jgi:hypothetical protein